MNKEIRVYTDFDSWWDYRKGLLFKLITDSSKSTLERTAEILTKWDQYAEKLYAERRFERYDFPHLNITHEQFLEAYKNRSVDDIVFYVPSNLNAVLFKTFMEIETQYDQYRGIRSIEIDLNTYPYIFDEQLQKELIESLRNRFRNRFKVNLIYRDISKITPLFFKNYSYVYKYDILLGDYPEFTKNLAKEPIPEVVFFVPDIYIKAVENITGKPADVIDAFAMTVAPQIGLKSVHHSIYDNTK